MKSVFLLGVLSLFALSISAPPETSLTAPSETSLTSLNRGVRHASKEVQRRLKRGIKSKTGRKGKKGKKGTRGKGLKDKRRKVGDGKKSTNGKGRRKGKGKKMKEGRNAGKKGKKGKKEQKKKGRRGGNRKKERKGQDSKGGKEGNKKSIKKQRQPRGNCENFFTTETIRDYRYAGNMFRKANRAKRTKNSLTSKRDKSATFFIAGAEFYRDCPEGSEIYEILKYRIIYLRVRFHNLNSEIAP